MDYTSLSSQFVEDFLCGIALDLFSAYTFICNFLRLIDLKWISEYYSLHLGHFSFFVIYRIRVFAGSARVFIVSWVRQGIVIGLTH